MNIQSYGGGNRLSSEGSPTDGLIEVIFVSNIVRAASVLALSPVMPFVRFKVAAKTDNVYIRTKCPLHCQVDGEPWLQDEGVFQVKFHSRKSILVKENNHASCGCMSSSEESVIE
jgi:diacylglycerol kinase family enzyme